MNADLSGEAEYYDYDDIRLEQIFTQTGERQIHLYYVDQDGGLMDEIKNVYALAYTFYNEDYDKCVAVSLGTILS